MIRRALIVALMTLVFAAPISSQAVAGEPDQEMEIILDASGSMWAQIKGEPKISIAKKALVEMVKGLEGRDDLLIAIRVYGHQHDKSKKNCQDTKLESKFAPPSVAAASAVAGRVTAKGQTPIAYSLLQAKGDFDFTKERNHTIVLITDGLESCDGDPCKVAKELAAAGVDVKMHVVGFDLGPAEMAKLKCLVEPSGGLLIAAGDAAQLGGALDQIVRKALSYNLVISGFNAKKEPIGVFAEAFKAGTKERVAYSAGKKAKFSLSPGTYDVTVKSNVTSETTKLSGVKVKEDEKTEKDVVFGAGKVGVTAKGSAGEPVEVYLTVVRPDGTREEFIGGVISSGAPKFVKVVPGTYRLKVENRKTKEVKVIDDVAVADGQQVVKELKFGKARIGIVGKDASGNPIDVLVDLRLKEGEKYRLVASAHTEGKMRYFDVPPGTYQITIWDRKSGKQKKLEGVVLKDGEETTKAESF